MIEVSVIIPCYNSGSTLLRAVESIQDQTIKNIEIIIVNDGSDDSHTLKVLRNISTQVKIITQKNMGLSFARNTGIREANGKYILPLDSDDYLLSNFVEKALRKIKEENTITCVYSDINMFGEREGILERNYNYFIQLFTNQLPYCLLYEKKIWSEIGGYDENMKLGYEDWEFNIRLGKNGYYPTRISEALFNYHLSNTGMLVSQSDKNYISILRDIRKKHRDVYRISELYRIWKKWRHKPMPYPTILYIGMYLATEFLPGNVYNYIYSKLRFLKQSERFSQ